MGEDDKPDRVWLVTQPYWPDIQSTSHLLTELVEASVEAGAAEFTVLCGFPALTDSSHVGKSPKTEIRHGVEIRRCGSRIDYKRSLVHRALALFAFVSEVTFRLPGRGHQVVAVTNPPFAPVWMWLVARVRRFRYSLICHDVFPDGLVALGKLPGEGWMARTWSRLNRRAYHEAVKTVVLGRDMADLLHERYGVPREKLIVAPHWSIADGGGTFAPEDTRLWSELGLGDSFVIQYSGNMGLWHDLDTVVRAAALLRDDSRFRFLLVGGGMRREAARSLAEKLDATNIEWLPFQPEETLADSLACCHLALISQREGLSGIAVPCKLYGILASGRGILALVPEASETARVVAEEGCGIRLDPHDPEALAAAVRKLADDRERVRALGEAAYASFRRKYRLEHGVSRYRPLWESNSEN